MKKMNTKLLVMLVSATLLLTFAVSGTVAYLADATGDVVNTFQPASVIPQINEPGWTENKTIKQNVSITNVGKTDGYFRVAIVVTWRDAAGNVYPEMPIAGMDYTIELNLGTGDGKWTGPVDPAQGFYYYNQDIAPNDTSEVLIKSCAPVLSEIPEGYDLHVAIAAQGIQSTGMGATGPVDAFQKAVDDPTKQ